MLSKTTLDQAGLIDASYVQLALEARNTRQRLIANLFSQRCMPEGGWDEDTVLLLLAELAAMDSNNFVDNVGIGEREGRTYSSLVRRRHFGFSHGMGRSGDVSAVQPKAAGSSLMVQLTNYLALQAIKLSGVTRTKSALVLPMATGMSVALTLCALRHPDQPQRQYVVWPRVDQKSCLKAIETAGFRVLVVDNTLDGDAVCTDLAALEEAIDSVGQDNVLCVLSNTSAFTPRVPDDVPAIATLCRKRGIAHVINNAFGLQSSKATHLINEACRVGRVDAFVQSTDKNFMVPVGGAVVASTNAKFVAAVSKTYSGRASSTPIMDLFVTLLQMGTRGWKAALKSRKELFPVMHERLSALAAEFGERVLDTRDNKVSMAMTMDSFVEGVQGGASFIGSMLYKRGVSGTRIVTTSARKTICDVEFEQYGAHYTGYPHVYLTASCALGITEDDIDVFIERLRKVLTTIRDMQAGHVDKEEDGVDVEPEEEEEEAAASSSSSSSSSALSSTDDEVQVE